MTHTDARLRRNNNYATYDLTQCEANNLPHTSNCNTTGQITLSTARLPKTVRDTRVEYPTGSMRILGTQRLTTNQRKQIILFYDYKRGGSTAHSSAASVTASCTVTLLRSRVLSYRLPRSVTTRRDPLPLAAVGCR